MQKRFGFYIEANRVVERLTPDGDTHSERSTAAIRKTQRLMQAHITALVIQLELSPRLTPEQWLWYQFSGPGHKFIIRLLSVTTVELDSALGALTNALRSLRPGTHLDDLVVCVDEAQVLCTDKIYSPPHEVSCAALFTEFLVQCLCVCVTQAFESAGDSRFLLSPVIYGIFSIVHKVVLCGTTLSLSAASTLGSSLHKTPGELPCATFRIINEFRPWSHEEFEALLASCLKNPETLADYTLPASLFPRMRCCSLGCG